MSVSHYVADGVGYLPVFRHDEVVSWAKVDEADLERVAARRWTFHPKGYVQSREGHGPALLLHREVFGLPGAQLPTVRFRNRSDLTDCRRQNLGVSSSWLAEQVRTSPELRRTVESVALGLSSRRGAA